MLGPDYVEPPARSAAATATSGVVTLTGWTRTVPPRLDRVDVTVAHGEVLGLFGLAGSGAETVARGLGGHETAIRGTLTVQGRTWPVPRSPRRAAALGIGYIPAERKADGLALNRPISEHLTLLTPARVSRRGWLSWRRLRAVSRELVTNYDVRCRSVDQPVGELSGGNQQKVLLAGRVAADPQVLVLHEPTRGVDIGSRAQIHGTLADVARGGAAVVLVTSDPHEAVDATDRLLVLRDGRVVAELTGPAKTTAAALAAATGGAHV
jgi:ABC-type sugar transport system ATPase subunit